MMLYRVPGQIVGLWEAVQGQANMRANRILGEQCDQDGFHHHHGNVLTDAGTRARPERLKIAARSLEKDRGQMGEIVKAHEVTLGQKRYKQTNP